MVTYLEEMRAVLNKTNLPDGLLLIPAICSGFNPESVNSVGGTGYWHLNYPQALKFGLTVNTVVDERKDLAKSTQAALDYLQHLYQIYNDWELALAAYACGPVTVNNALRRSGASSYSDIYTKLPATTRDLPLALPAFYAVWMQEFNQTKPLAFNLETDTVRIQKVLDFKNLEDVLGVSRSDLIFLNTTLLKSQFPKDYIATFPKKIKMRFNQEKDSIYAYQEALLLAENLEGSTTSTPSSTPVIYKVKSGDVLGVIAERFGVRVSELQDWNNLKNTQINVGQELLIYSESVSATTPSKASPKKFVSKSSISAENKPLSAYVTYTVKSGDNLWLIARKFPGISAQNIMDLNGIDANLNVGQVLKIKLKQ
jgi:membrane-bound lytic murein transglycosylase D